MNDYLHALPAGHRLGEYRIERVLGSGGFGITYYAWDIHLDKPVAIKEYLPNEFALRTDETTVKPKSTADQDNYQWGLERFLEEARTLARFKNPYLNEVHRLFEDNDTAYIVLEYIEGETLSQILRREGLLDAARLERLLEELLSGLEEVHKAGFVHRDIKPSNIILRENGAAVLLDFGAARQAVGRRSKSITSILTPGYAPIEQYDLKGDDIGPWTDLYALGMVAYRCISGISDGDLPDAVGRARLERKGDQSKDLPPTVELGKGRYDAALLKAVDSAIRIDEEQRPQSVAAMRETLVGSDEPEVTAADKVQSSDAMDNVAQSPPKSIEDAAGNEKEPDSPRWQNMKVAVVVGAVLVVLASLPVWPQVQEGMYWRSVQCNESKEVQQYLAKYPGGRYKREAKACLAEAQKKRFSEVFGRDASPYAKDDDGLTDLHYASAANMSKLAGFLLDAGANVHARVEENQDFIRATSKSKLRKLTKTSIFDSFLRSGATPLHFAARGNAHKAAQLLISHGADVQAKDEDGWTPLHHAAGQNARDTAQLLISLGADVQTKAKDGYTPLHWAARKNARDTALLLISHGADVQAKNKNGATPLHWAAGQNARDTAQLLISHGADVQAKNEDGWTPLHSAAMDNARDTAQSLIFLGADVQAKDKNGSTPLHWAAMGNARDTAQLLISLGADVQAKREGDVTPLHLAALSLQNARDTAQLLISFGADVNAKDQNGETPLHWAAWRNARDTAQLLISLGADVYAKDKASRMPWDVAITHGHSEMAQLLR